MKKSILCLGLCAALSSVNSFADALAWGDAKAESGQFKINGAIRTRYQYKDFADDAMEGKNSDWKLADIKLMLSYENPNWMAYSDVRCYQYDKLCDAIFLNNAWVGYKISPEQKVWAGLVPVDFGLGRFWGTSYYETIFNTLGFEDISNLGLKYQFKNADYSATLGFYPTDGGNFKGTSKDSSRYSGNFVEADDLEHGTNIREKNMWIGRVSKTIQIDPQQNLNTEIGASYWHSDLDNKKTHQTGHKDNWNVFATTNYQNWQLITLAGQQRISNKDQLMPDASTIGAFDYPYQIANDGKYLSAELNYSYKPDFHGITGIKPYLSFSQFFKDQSGYNDSNRVIGGVAFNYKQIGVQAEYIVTRNDPFIGGSADALAQGDNNRWNKLLYIALGYYF